MYVHIHDNLIILYIYIFLYIHSLLKYFSYIVLYIDLK